MTQDNYLSHYGVMGMKWGVRKKRTSSSSSKRRKGPIRINININKTTKQKKSKSSKENIKALSDQELLDRVNRLTLEKRYRDLTSPQKSAGRKFVEQTLQDSGKKVAKKYVAKGIDASVDALLRKTRAAMR